jgi:hypothetical protein
MRVSFLAAGCLVDLEDFVKTELAHELLQKLWLVSGSSLRFKHDLMMLETDSY